MAGKILSLTLLISIAWKATAQEVDLANPNYFVNDSCYIKEIDKSIPAGTGITPPGHCFRAECGNGELNYTICGEAKTDEPHCYIKGIDLTKSFPGCCPFVECFRKTNLGSD